MNAVYTFYRKRQYRLFESSVDVMPSTPSVRRVRVDTNPMSSSPLRFLSTMISDNSAQSRAHPDAQRDVWELSVWDPMPLCLRLFCLFSPGHVLVYWFFLPASPQDARPSTTVATTIALVTLLSIQLSLLQGNFSQQSKDTSVIHREVLNEYDVKYVHPRTQHIMRDVGTQFSGPETPKRRSTGPGLGGNNGVETYTPVTVINKGFHTNPNPNYTRHVDPDADTKKDSPPRRDLTRFSETPQREIPRVKETPQRQIPNGPSNPLQPSARLRDFSSPIAPRTVQRQPQFRSSQAPGVSDGGNLGIYSHAQSPLKKSASTQFNANQRFGYVRDGQRRESGRF